MHATVRPVPAPPNEIVLIMTLDEAKTLYVYLGYMRDMYYSGQSMGPTQAALHTVRHSFL